MSRFRDSFPWHSGMVPRSMASGANTLHNVFDGWAGNLWTSFCLSRLLSGSPAGHKDAWQEAAGRGKGASWQGQGPKIAGTLHWRPLREMLGEWRCEEAPRPQIAVTPRPHTVKHASLPPDIPQHGQMARWSAADCWVLRPVLCTVVHVWWMMDDGWWMERGGAACQQVEMLAIPIKLRYHPHPSLIEMWQQSGSAGEIAPPS